MQLVGLLHRAGRSHEAQALCYEALGIYERAHGADHPRTKNAASWSEDLAQQAADDDDDGEFF